MEALKSFKHRGYTVEIHQDDDPPNPRTDMDNLGTMVSFHRNHTLGDKHTFKSADEVMAHIKATKAVWLPVYLYDHSGLTINTTGFSCPWDSGQVGVVFVEREKALKEFGGKRPALTRSVRAKVEKCLRGEVETYDQMLRGEVYGYDVKKGDEIVESCSGFYGDMDYCIDEAKGVAESLAKAEALKHAAKVKAYIQNKVPLQARVALA
jgi:hypothetical protein